MNACPVVSVRADRHTPECGPSRKVGTEDGSDQLVTHGVLKRGRVVTAHTSCHDWVAPVHGVSDAHSGPLDPILAPPVVDRLVADVKIVCDGALATLQPSASRSRTLRRNSDR